MTYRNHRHFCITLGLSRVLAGSAHGQSLIRDDAVAFAKTQSSRVLAVSEAEPGNATAERAESRCGKGAWSVSFDHGVTFMLQDG